MKRHIGPLHSTSEWKEEYLHSRTGRPIMSFFLQLKLLVWKNYTLRKRQWVGICHVIKMWELFWIPFSGSITCRDCLATHTLSNSLPCQTQRAEKESPWMWVLSFELCDVWFCFWRSFWREGHALCGINPIWSKLYLHIQQYLSSQFLDSTWDFSRIQ